MGRYREIFFARFPEIYEYFMLQEYNNSSRLKFTAERIRIQYFIELCRIEYIKKNLVAVGIVII